MDKNKLKIKLKDLKKQVRQILDELNELEQIIEEGKGEPPEHLKDKLKVLWEIKKAGGVVSKDKAREYWISLGKDPRGFGGLFQGYGKLIQLADNKVGLSQEADKLIENYKDWLQKQLKSEEY